MANYGCRQPRVGLVVVCMLATGVGCVGAQPAEKKGQAPEPGRALEALKAAGKNASLTVVPVNLGGSPSKQVAEVVGLMLERGGMENLEIATAEFRPPEKADLAQTAKALADFVRANPVKTDYALFADFIGSPGKGVDEIRGIVVSKSGEVVWQDRQTPDDADFKQAKPDCPMDCCLLLIGRLRPVLGLEDPTRADAPEGKLAKRWREKSGVPSDADTAAMKEQQDAFKKAAPKATLLVYPVHAGDALSPESAANLAKLITEAKLMKATAADTGPQLDIQRDMNEQKVLWSMAQAFREHVQKEPPAADYVLYADYLMGKDAVGGVHFAICDRKGQWVIVDFQNSHWEDFQSIKPKSREDCDRLVLKRLEGYCK